MKKLGENRKKARKIGSFLVALMLLFAVSPLSSKAASDLAAQQIDKMNTNVIAADGKDTVELLKENAPNSEVITQIPTLSTVTILDKGSEYTHVTYVDPKTQEVWTGYILNTNLADPSQSTTKTKDEKSTDTTVQGESKDSSNTDTAVQKENKDSSSTDTVAQKENKVSSNTLTSETNSKETTKSTDQTKTLKPLAAKSDLDVRYQSLQGIGLKNPTNVYQVQDTNSNVLKSYAQGTLLKYEAPIPQWYQCTVILNGEPTTGYIYASDVETTDDSEYVLIGTALQSPTNVYSAPSLDSTVLKSYAQGKTLQYNQNTIDWYECTVVINGVATHGYIKAEDVENVNDEQKSFRGIGLKAPTNIYSKASVNSKTVKTYAQGTILKYKTFTADWYECTVYVNGKAVTGYISKNDVENIVDSQQSLKGVGLSSPTNIYSSASTSAKVLKSYDQGTVLQYLTFTSDWYECTVIIKGNKVTGYIKASNVDNVVSPQQNMRGIAQKDVTKIYSKASTSSKVLKSYSKYTILSYRTFTSNWFECTVYVNGVATTGYIKNGDVSIQKETNYNLSFNDAVTMQMNASPKADGAGKVNATIDQVSYYLNPNNFAQNSSEYYQFLLLSSYAGTSASELNNNILKGKGILDGHGQAFITAAKTYNINELYLISHSLLETGNGTSQLATGVKINGVTVYNMYGIGATDGNATQNGAQYAYDHGWTTVDKAIIEGAQFVSDNYIHNGQDTLYKMRWNPAGMVLKGYANHQYATDVGWAVKQTTTLANLYNQLTIYTLLFEVPVYNF
ncbi:N-acetylglucosaminidase [Margalitia sp. FSL K6-0131]|uniref:N-acetylglucosaminidase n=1 Tax=Margalitia sp. FSL K6-0131 TaxID=2954604 RepID=UPI0030F87458